MATWYINPRKKGEINEWKSSKWLILQISGLKSIRWGGKGKTKIRNQETEEVRVQEQLTSSNGLASIIAKFRSCKFHFSI